jgi:hypothetical protein
MESAEDGLANVERSTEAHIHEENKAKPSRLELRWSPPAIQTKRNVLLMEWFGLFVSAQFLVQLGQVMQTSVAPQR